MAEMLEFQSYDGLQRLTLEIGSNKTPIVLRRWVRGEVDGEWEEDMAMTLFPFDSVRRMTEALVPMWSAQARAEGEHWN